MAKSKAILCQKGSRIKSLASGEVFTIDSIENVDMDLADDGTIKVVSILALGSWGDEPEMKIRDCFILPSDAFEVQQ